MTSTQEIEQAEGPHRPTAEKLGLMLLRLIPSHFEVRAISINGQTGTILVDVRHEDMEKTLKLR